MPTVNGVYVHPPRVRDAELNWPYARCKNLIKILNPKAPRMCHYDALIFIAKRYKVTVEVLKSTSAKKLVDNYTLSLLFPSRYNMYY